MFKFLKHIFGSGDDEFKSVSKVPKIRNQDPNDDPFWWRRDNDAIRGENFDHLVIDDFDPQEECDGVAVDTLAKALDNELLGNEGNPESRLTQEQLVELGLPETNRPIDYYSLNADPNTWNCLSALCTTTEICSFPSTVMIGDYFPPRHQSVYINDNHGVINL